MNELQKKLIEIQKELKAPKSQYNKFGGFYYRSCEDILEAVKPLLHKKNLLLSITDKIQIIGDRYYVKTTARISDGKDEISVSAYAREEEAKKGMDGSQITGASSSYARKYALNGMFLIDDAKDSDVTNKGQDKIKKSKPTNEEKFIDDLLVCEECNEKITEKVRKYSEEKFGKALCFKCQKEVTNESS